MESGVKSSLIRRARIVKKQYVLEWDIFLKLRGSETTNLSIKVKDGLFYLMPFESLDTAFAMDCRCVSFKAVARQVSKIVQQSW